LLDEFFWTMLEELMAGRLPVERTLMEAEAFRASS
jgi:hypothetical protein